MIGKTYIFKSFWGIQAKVSRYLNTKYFVGFKHSFSGLCVHKQEERGD